MVSLAAALEKEGISSFRFDFSGNGYGFGMSYTMSYFSLLLIYLFIYFVNLYKFSVPFPHSMCLIDLQGK